MPAAMAGLTGSFASTRGVLSELGRDMAAGGEFFDTGSETSALRLSTLVFAILIATIYETMHDDYRRESVLYYGKKLPESRAPQK